MREELSQNRDGSLSNRFESNRFARELRGTGQMWEYAAPRSRAMNDPKWKHDGVRVIPGHSLDPNTAQTPGMDRRAAINLARAGAQKLWAGTVSIHANA